MEYELLLYLFLLCSYNNTDAHEISQDFSQTYHCICVVNLNIYSTVFIKLGVFTWIYFPIYFSQWISDVPHLGTGYSWSLNVSHQLLTEWKAQRPLEKRGLTSCRVQSITWIGITWLYERITSTIGGGENDVEVHIICTVISSSDFLHLDDTSPISWLVHSKQISKNQIFQSWVSFAVREH